MWVCSSSKEVVQGSATVNKALNLVVDCLMSAKHYCFISGFIYISKFYDAFPKWLEHLPCNPKCTGLGYWLRSMSISFMHNCPMWLTDDSMALYAVFNEYTDTDDSVFYYWYCHLWDSFLWFYSFHKQSQWSILSRSIGSIQCWLTQTIFWSCSNNFVTKTWLPGFPLKPKRTFLRL